MNIKKMIKDNKKEIKSVTSVRINASDKELLINTFGSVQKALNALIKEVKGQ